MLLALASRKQEAGGWSTDPPAGLSYTSFLFLPLCEINFNLARVVGTHSFTLFLSRIILIKLEAGSEILNKVKGL